MINWNCLLIIWTDEFEWNLVSDIWTPNYVALFVLGGKVGSWEMCVETRLLFVEHKIS